MKLDFSRPRKPTDNAFIESFNGRLRNECLNQHLFLSLDEARAVTEAWRDDYNRIRPHGALDNLFVHRGVPDHIRSDKQFLHHGHACEVSQT